MLNIPGITPIAAPTLAALGIKVPAAPTVVPTAAAAVPSATSGGAVPASPSYGAVPTLAPSVGNAQNTQYLTGLLNAIYGNGGVSIGQNASTANPLSALGYQSTPAQPGLQGAAQNLTGIGQIQQTGPNSYVIPVSDPGAGGMLMLPVTTDASGKILPVDTSGITYQGGSNGSVLGGFGNAAGNLVGGVVNAATSNPATIALTIAALAAATGGTSLLGTAAAADAAGSAGAAGTAAAADAAGATGLASLPASVLPASTAFGVGGGTTAVDAALAAGAGSGGLTASGAIVPIADALASSGAQALPLASTPASTALPAADATAYPAAGAISSGATGTLAPIVASLPESTGGLSSLGAAAAGLGVGAATAGLGGSAGNGIGLPSNSAMQPQLANNPATPGASTPGSTGLLSYLLNNPKMLLGLLSSGAGAVGAQSAINGMGGASTSSTGGYNGPLVNKPDQPMFNYTPPSNTTQNQPQVLSPYADPSKYGQNISNTSPLVRQLTATPNAPQLTASGVQYIPNAQLVQQLKTGA